MEKSKNDVIGPVYFLWFGCVDRVAAHDSVQTIAFQEGFRSEFTIFLDIRRLLPWCPPTERRSRPHIRPDTKALKKRVIAPGPTANLTSVRYAET